MWKELYLPLTITFLAMFGLATCVYFLFEINSAYLDKRNDNVEREETIGSCVDIYRDLYKVKGSSEAPLAKCELVVDGKDVL